MKSSGFLIERVSKNFKFKVSLIITLIALLVNFLVEITIIPVSKCLIK